MARGLHRKGTLEHTYVDPLGWECLSDPSDVAVAEVEAGGVVVFSSLTPHLTGPNVTGQVRKAYILQYAPEGATILRGDPTAAAPTAREPANDPRRQYPVVRGGRPVDAAGGGPSGEIGRSERRTSRRRGSQRAKNAEG